MLVWPQFGRKVERQQLLKALCPAPRLSILEFAAPSCYELPGACGGRPSSVTDLDVVGSVCTGLRKLEVDFSALHGADDIPREFYRSMSQLREVSVPLTQTSHLRGLGTLPFLERLAVQIEHPLHDPSLTSVAPFSGFTKLRELYVGESSSHVLTDIVSAISSPHLTLAQAHIVATCQPEAASALETLSSRPCAQQLQTIHVSLTFFDEHVPSNDQRLDFPFHPLANPLFRLAKLEDLSIRASG
ncbi:hypothetical protein C8Q80DRAFT_1193327 [Daedaleopsis nitida]|nr:hypothetical protein C8Q80DRAFT_1193327 [Daedaleopsis nitida]